MCTRDAIWAALLHSARWERYYGVLASRSRRLEMCIRFVLLVFAMGAITSVLAEMADEVRIASAAFVAIVVALDFFVKPSQTVATLLLIRDECGRLKLALNELWRQQSSMDDAEANRLLRELNANLHYITSKDPAVVNNRVNEQTTDAVFEEARTGHVS